MAVSVLCGSALCVSPLADFRLHTGERHEEVYAEYAAARARCDSEDMWMPIGLTTEELNESDPRKRFDAFYGVKGAVAYQYHRSTKQWQGCDEDERDDELEIAPWARDGSNCTIAARRSWCATGSQKFRCAEKRYAPWVIDPAEDGRGPSKGLWAVPKRENCRVRVGPEGEGETFWTFYRMGPMAGYGGYDWHQVQWDLLGPTRDGEMWEVDAWYVGATDDQGATLGFPPVHVHHAHVATRSRALDALLVFFLSLRAAERSRGATRTAVPRS